ncbi:MAG: outer membrane protein assembly factor BamC [Betaproteobacteria bacterium]|nr:outer membrane protein assembly factor BamC [Betaproteobacteria bacterium]MCL2887404.1 outer membrane protein assembly factor BamC [Betaproteobacteria bacterium]
MNHKFSAFSLTLITLTLAGCGMLPSSSKIDYRSAKQNTSPLEIPPDLSQLAPDNRYIVPDAGGGKGSATYSGYEGERTPAALARNSTLLPQVDKIRVERSGNQRWLVVAMPPEGLWDTVKDFWQETGFIINIERRDAGVMETDWAENRAKIPDDIVRRTLGKLLDSFYSSGERDKFRTRFEPGAEPGTTDIFISHRAMEEVYTSTSSKDETRWQPKAPDPELEAEMLRRLMVRLGTEEKRAEAQLAAAKSEPRARMARADDGAGTLEVDGRFDRAWRQVGLALDRVGFTVEDRDRSRGLYFVRYVDPETDNKKDSGGWFSKLAFWKSSDSAESKVQYRIHVGETGQKSTVQVLTSEGGADRSETAKKILSLLLEQLQ